MLWNIVSTNVKTLSVSGNARSPKRTISRVLLDADVPTRARPAKALVAAILGFVARPQIRSSIIQTFGSDNVIV